ncbi:uncharacterized protein LOC125243078 isoform X2 [Megalobrama amblycephala]|uniref:uncharacterized protein LOC125243078 isoform X2 n=1 Tax=Megalobrama amblycephala TaxID=75352 RepID=UPI0020147A09|nr:uncharacterized protein LOC125243078 isoform X2 [Megalobrama amblycephala]
MLCPFHQVKTAAEVAQCIIKFFHQFEVLKRILTDPGTVFVNAVLLINKNVCVMLGIKRSLCSPYHPQTNGLVERMNGTIQRALSKLVAQKLENWDEYLEAVMFGLRKKKQITTKFSPFFLMFGREALYPTEVPEHFMVVKHNQIGNYLLTEELPAASLDPQVEFEKNMESLSAMMSDSPEIQRASSSWTFRQQQASQRWKEARPFHLKCLIQTQDVGQPFCSKPAVVRCRSVYQISGSVKPAIPRITGDGHSTIGSQSLRAFFPSTYFVRGEGGYSSHDQACILPTVRVTQKCPCEVPSITVSPGKAVILISINGRYDMHQPLFACQTCQQQWAPEFMDLVNSGYWPASTSSSTLNSLNLFSIVRELKIIAPALSRQAFAKLLEHRTKCGGQSGPVCGDTLQRSFLEFSYCAFEEDNLSCGAPFTCPACTPDMLAISVDGNRKLYRFLLNGSSDSLFFEGAFIAEDTSVSAFVDVLH